MLSFTGQNNQKGSKKNLQNPKILEVNLIKDEAGIFFNWNKHLLTLVIVLFLAALFVMEMYLGLDWWEKQEIARAQILTESVSRVNREITGLKNQASVALDYKDKSAAFGELLDNHVYWTNLFSWLEKNTLSSVRYGGFTGNLSGAYSFGAQASSYADVSWQAKVLENDPLTHDVEVLMVEGGQGENQTAGGQVSFVMGLKINPEIFKK